MRFDVITLFPELFGPHLTLGVTRRAYESAQLEVKLWPLRDFADNAYRRVDDRPYGGGPGMVMLAEPLERALQAVRVARSEADPAPLVLFSPTGRRIDQALVREWATGAGAVLLCGRYEGVDQRFIDRHGALELSLGDFVLSGGELPALALLDAIARHSVRFRWVRGHSEHADNERCDRLAVAARQRNGLPPDEPFENGRRAAPQQVMLELG